MKNQIIILHPHNWIQLINHVFILIKEDKNECINFVSR